MIGEMVDKLCPDCKKINSCTVIDERLLNYTYNCSDCNNTFERKTYFNAIGSTAIALAGLVLVGKNTFFGDKGKDKKT